MKKALVCYVVEQSLLEIGGEAMLNTVNDMLKSKHNSTIDDSYENPHNLVMVIKYLFGDSYHKIITDINQNLNEFSYQKSIARFLKEIKLA